MQKKSGNYLEAVVLALVLSVVPLIVSAFHFNLRLKDYPWFGNTVGSYDFFLFWKGVALCLLNAVLLLIALVKRIFIRGRQYQMGDVQAKYVVLLMSYLLLTALSGALSEQVYTAVIGGYEQWEGTLVILAYVMLSYDAYLFLREDAEFSIIRYGILAGAFVMSVLGALQAFGYDFFRTEAGQAVMNFMSDQKLKFSFNFERGRVFASLHNPNYVGSYVALMLPVVLAFISVGKKEGRSRVVSVVRSAAAIVTGINLVIMLFGSESVTGCIGIFASFLLFAVFFVVYNRKHPVGIVILSAAAVSVTVVAVVINRPVFEYGMNKILHPTPNHFFVTGMESEDGKLHITTEAGDCLELSCGESSDGEDGFDYRAEDAEGKNVMLFRDGDTDRIHFQDERFEKIELYETSVSDEGGTDRDGFVVDTPSFGKSYTIIPVSVQEGNGGEKKMTYQMYTPFGRLDELRKIEAAGFEKRQHFGSRRGYIWSRTLPLLKKHILLGSGPNTFIYEFPNDDYVGMKNVGYDGAVVTKPHNMFMQIWVQSGLLSLVAFLGLYIIYFAESIKLYLQKKEAGASDYFAIGILLGTFGYIVTGLANDSSVAVAPLYWVLLGTGMALNRYNGNRSRQHPVPGE